MKFSQLASAAAVLAASEGLSRCPHSADLSEFLPKTSEACVGYTKHDCKSIPISSYAQVCRAVHLQ